VLVVVLLSFVVWIDNREEHLFEEKNHLEREVDLLVAGHRPLYLLFLG